MALRFVYGFVFVLTVAGCDSGGIADDDAGQGLRDAGSADAGAVGEDASVAPDAGPAPEDAGSTPDDAGSEPPDAGVDAGPPDAGPADAGVDAGPVCSVGVPCDSTGGCPDGQRCFGHGGDGFCSEVLPECGGFLMTDCTGGRECIRGGGGSLGYCATPAEKICICDSAAAHGITTDGCR